MLLEKAVSLARSVGAEIHLFSCDAGLARRMRHSYVTQDAEKAWTLCLAEHLTYLRRLQAQVSAPGVRITTDAACHSPLHEGIVAKIREIRPDLVMKAPAGEHPLRRLAFDSSDWKLAKMCPTTLMLVRPHRWRTAPRFAALVDMSEEDTAAFAQTIVHTSVYFTLGCRGELDVIYSAGSTNACEKAAQLQSLERLVHEYHVEPGHVHVLDGHPNVALPDFVAHGNFDAIALGARTHQSAIANIHGTLTSRIADTVDCDLILVPRGDQLRLAEEDSSIAHDCAIGVD